MVRRRPSRESAAVRGGHAVAFTGRLAIRLSLDLRIGVPGPRSAREYKSYPFADPNNSNNFYFALRRTSTAPKFIPRSIDVTIVLTRLREVIPDEFTPEQHGFAAQHFSRRNEELHTGSTPFDGVKTDWLGPFYLTCTILLKSIGESLSLLVGGNNAKIAETLIAASIDESAKAVMKAIAAHKTVWDATDPAEREKAARQASTWATRQSGHRVVCPACASDALLAGTPISEPQRTLDDDSRHDTLHIHEQSSFFCGAGRPHWPKPLHPLGN
jgi:hypothetical protein